MENFHRREMPRSPAVAVVGATGAVGIELMSSLERRRFPLRSLRLYASPRSAGKRLSFRGEAIAVEALGEKSLAGIDIALFSAGSATSQQFAPAAAAAGTIVVDNSSAFRMRPDVPLIVPEINGAEIAAHQGLIANPIRRIVLASYQAASGAGAAAMAELTAATAAYLEGRDYQTRVLRHPSAFNLFSHDTPIDPATGYNGEETKVMNEMRKIFAAPEMRISATCVRVPVLRAHSLALTVECAQPMAPEEARVLLAAAPGVRVVDDIEHNYFPMPKDASGQDTVLVGRLRRDVSDPTGRSLALFAAGDQLLKGAALNAVQIAERLLPRG